MNGTADRHIGPANRTWRVPPADARRSATSPTPTARGRCCSCPSWPASWFWLVTRPPPRQRGPRCPRPATQAPRAGRQASIQLHIVGAQREAPLLQHRTHDLGIA